MSLFPPRLFGLANSDEIDGDAHFGTVIPGRASSREPGTQAAVRGEVIWIPGSVLRTAPE
jgi:hypothetical protein